MICHICQTDKPLQGGCIYSNGSLRLWACTLCSGAMDRVVELENVVRQIRDRLQQLQIEIKEEPWMTRLANKAFQPVFPGLREASLELDMVLWRKTS